MTGGNNLHQWVVIKLRWLIIPASSYLTQMRRIRLGGLGACFPIKLFWKFDALRWLLRHILGLITSLGCLRFSLWIFFRAMPIKNVWSPRSQSACSQVSAVLFYARTTKLVLAQICVNDMHVSCLQAKGRQHHLGQNIRPAIAGSARPASSALSEGNECVKETRFKVKFQKLTQKWGGPDHPSRPTSGNHLYKSVLRISYICLDCNLTRPCGACGSFLFSRNGEQRRLGEVAGPWTLTVRGLLVVKTYMTSYLQNTEGSYRELVSECQLPERQLPKCQLRKIWVASLQWQLASIIL